MRPGHHWGVLDTYCAGRATRSASIRGFVLTGLLRDLEVKEYTADITKIIDRYPHHSKEPMHHLDLGAEEAAVNILISFILAVELSPSILPVLLLEDVCDMVFLTSLFWEGVLGD